MSCGRGAHRFHRRCIRNWARLSARCPLCRSEITAPAVTCTTPAAMPQAFTPPAPTLAERRETAVEGELSRLRSQSEGPEAGRASTQVMQEAHTTSSATANADEPQGNAVSGRGANADTPRSSQNAAIAAAASGYGRALASAAMASASRYARAAAPSASGSSTPSRTAPSTPGASTSTPSTAPSTPAARPPRRPSGDERMTRAAKARPTTPESWRALSNASRLQATAHHVQQGSATRSDDAHVHDDILDIAVAASFPRASSEPDRAVQEHSPIRHRAVSEGPEVGTPTTQNSALPRPPLQVGRLLRRAPSPAPTAGDNSTNGEPLSGRAPSTSRSNGVAPASSVAIATAATGYGRALASAAVASSLRRVAARPSLPASEDGHASMAAVRSALPTGGPRSMLARTGQDVLSRASPSAASRGNSRGSSQPAVEVEGIPLDADSLERRRSPSR